MTANDQSLVSPVAGYPRPPLDIGRCFTEATEVYKANFRILVLAAIATDVLTLFTLGILGGVISGGWVIMGLRALRREDHRVDFGDLFRAFDRFGALLGMFIMYLVLGLIATLMCIVPGILLGTVWMFCFALLVEKRMGVFGAFGASYRVITRRAFGPLLGLQIIMCVLIVPCLIPYIGMVIGWLIMPMLSLISLSAYRQVVDDSLCLVCGYDLRGTVDAGGQSCPECGQPVPSAMGTIR